MRFALDTSAVSLLERTPPGDPLLARIELHEGAIAIPTVVWHELQYGYACLPDGRRKDDLARFLDQVALRFPQVEYGKPAAEWHARERARLRREGRTAPFADGQIAAIAAVNGLAVVTRNLADFEPFSVECVDWS